MCLHPRQSDTYLTTFLSDTLIRPYHYLIGRFYKKSDSLDIHGNTIQYSQAGIARVSAVVGTVIASVMLVGSIVVLYSLKSMGTRLLATGLFTAAFSLGLCVLTNGRMVEIFSATAA